MKRVLILAAAMLVATVTITGSAGAQAFVLRTPEASPKAWVGQRIGLTDIEIVYNRPGVNKRQVWGELVPYNEVWRAGANENTTISFSTDVTVGGKALPAGEYGLHMIPTEKDWTIIFSTQSKAWGSYSYDPKEDAARITVTPQQVNFEERMRFSLDDPTDKSVTVALTWEKLRVPFNVEVDVNKVVVAELREQLRSMPRFFWQGWNQAAAWCSRNNTNLDEALTWVDRSIEMNENFTNLFTKAALLDKKNGDGSGDDLRDKAMKMATEADMNNYAYGLMGRGKQDEALKVFKQNVKDHPKSWNAHDSLAEAYATLGKKKDAVKHYQEALQIVKDAEQRKRIETSIAKLQ
jgi:hypothetical protein